MTTLALVTTKSRKRRRDAFERSVAALRAFRETATPEEMERVAVLLERAVAPAPPSDVQRELIGALAGGRTYSAKERVALETANVARYFERRRELLQDSLSTPKVAALLGVTRQTPHDRVKAGTLLAVRERGGWRFPRWQFDSDGPDGVIAGFAEAVRALDVSPLAKVSWFTRTNPYLQGKTPLDALKSGESERVIALARAVGVN